MASLIDAFEGKARERRSRHSNVELRCHPERSDPSRTSEGDPSPSTRLRMTRSMFEEFFGFATKPFGKTPDPSFLYESPQHREALARLEYAVDEKELAVLVGEIGSG